MEYLWPILAAVLGIAAGAFLGYMLYKRSSEKRIGRAEEVAARLVDEAKNRAEILSKERINEAKEEVHRLRNECDRECKERRAEIQKSEKRYTQREEQLEKSFLHWTRVKRRVRRRRRSFKNSLPPQRICRNGGWMN